MTQVRFGSIGFRHSEANKEKMRSWLELNMTQRLDHKTLAPLCRSTQLDHFQVYDWLKKHKRKYKKNNQKINQ